MVSLTASFADFEPILLFSILPHIPLSDIPGPQIPKPFQGSLV